MAAPLLETPLVPAPRLEELKARSRKRRQRRTLRGSAIVSLVVIVVVASVLAAGSGGRSPATTARLASYIRVGVSVPDSVLNKVGLPSFVAPPEALQGQPALTDGGLPAVVYVGAEYCPFCAIQRWALIVALSRFGTFHNLGQAISSSSTDLYPGLRSWSFHGSSYVSRSLRFDPAEITTSKEVVRNGDSYFTPLDKLSPLQRRAFDTYDAPPYDATWAAGSGSVPFVDFGNRFLMQGASDPSVLEKLSLDRIAADLSDPSSPVAQAIDGSANYIIANLCSITGFPAAVLMCSSRVVAEALRRAWNVRDKPRLPLARPASSG